MGFIYQEANAYGVEALVALERHSHPPRRKKYCTAVTEAVRICDTYGIPERELVPQVRHIAAAEEYLLEHLSEDEETLQFLFTPSLRQSNTCLAWFLVWDYVRPGGEKAYKYTGHTPQQRLRTSSPPWASIRKTPPRRSSWTPSATSSTTWTSPACPLPTGGDC